MSRTPGRGTRLTPLDVLGATPFVLLTTFRGNGDPVATPVWVVRQGDVLLVRTVSGTGKVKRIRANSRVLVAPCTRRAKPLGKPIEATAEILGQDPVRQVERLLSDKYLSAVPYLPIVHLLERRREMAAVALAIRLAESDPGRPAAATR